MQSDRELLELAAKAVGIPLKPDFAERFDYYMADPLMWNPLQDDGDALRLAIKLRITIRLGDSSATSAGWAEHQRVSFTTDGFGPWHWKEWNNEDACRATRRAIVRAAAEIGRNTAKGDGGGV